MGLREYKAKRDFRKTAEPAPKRKSSRGALLFVIQKHDASRLHYDFRLELDGVLKSWAVPKGVPFEKADKRLAMHVEDHPLDYARFEGIIPKGQYGGGTVMVWDIGTWEPLGGDPRRDLEKGKLHFALHGEKLDGEWTLVAMHGGEENAWLLLKSGESMRPVSKKRDDESVLSGRTMKQIATDKDAEWQSNRKEKKSGADFKKKIREKAAEIEHEQEQVAPRSPDSLKKLPSTKPAFVDPMKAKLVENPPQSDDWIFELKFDGFRAITIKRGASIELISRNQKSLTKKFPELIDPLRALPARDAVIDGEIVALDAEGRSSFQLLQAYEMHEKRPPICYYAFDLLHLDGKDLRRLPLVQRKSLLENLLTDAPDEIRFSASLEGDVAKLLEQIKQHGLEGLIGKKRDSQYETGRRSGAWVKIKVTNEQEFVIGGYSEPQGSRKFFGALLVGFYEKGGLLFASKVGSGYSEKTLRELFQKMKPLIHESCPFANLPTKRGGRWGQGITRAEMKRCTWIEPRLVCQVRFNEWTRDGGLRAPVFLGLRDDKPPKDVVRENPSR